MPSGKWLASLFALGCGPVAEPPASAELESQLPLAKFDFRQLVVDPAAYSRVDWAGALDVDQLGAGFTLSLVDVARAGFVRLDAYTPTGVDFGVWAGQPVLMSVAADPLTGEVSFAIARSLAPADLLYLYEPVRAARLSEDLFGPGLVAPANPIGTDALVGWAVHTRSAWMRTDQGDVELFPGEPQEVLLAQTPFRATLLASYAVEPQFVGPTGCTEPLERIAFELARVEAGGADLEPILRNPLIPPPLPACLE